MKRVHVDGVPTPSRRAGEALGHSGFIAIFAGGVARSSTCTSEVQVDSNVWRAINGRKIATQTRIDSPLSRSCPLKGSRMLHGVHANSSSKYPVSSFEFRTRARTSESDSRPDFGDAALAGIDFESTRLPRGRAQPASDVKRVPRCGRARTLGGDRRALARGEWGQPSSDTLFCLSFFLGGRRGRSGRFLWSVRK